MRRVLVILVLGAAACGGGGGSGSQAALTLDAASQAALSAMLGIGNGVQQAIPMLFVAPVAAANGIVFALDTSVGALPNTYTFHLPVDRDGNGTQESELNGSVTLDGGLLTFDHGSGGALTVTIGFDGGQRTFSGTFDFLLTQASALQLVGTGTFTDTTTSTVVEITIDAQNPLLLNLANGGSRLGNLCTFSASGVVAIEASSALGTYSAIWTFLQSSRQVAVTGASRTNESGTTPEPDSAFEVPCAAGRIQDWAGTYDFNWFCNPQEAGDSELIVTVTGPNTIHIVDDPGDDLEYDATAVPGNPHVVRGFFVTNGYREDFVWTLSADGKTLTQQSLYLFQPPLTGGGVCGGTGTKR